MIVKIQKPIFTTGVPCILIYDKKRTFHYQEPYDEKKHGPLFHGRLKVYVRAYLDKNNMLVIGKEVRGRSW